MFGFSACRPAPGDGGGSFDWPEWRQVRRILQAGVAADVGSFKTEMLALDREFPMSGRAGAYLWFSVRYQVAKRLQRRPTSNDILQLTKDMYPRFKRLVAVDEAILGELFQVVFELRSPTESSSGANLIVNGAAALAVLVSGPADLDDIEAHLVPWYDKNGGDFAALDPLGT